MASAGGGDGSREDPRVPAARAVAVEVRDFLDAIWPDWFEARGLPVPASPAESMCRISSAFLRDVLRREVGGLWTVVGGEPEVQPGFHHEYRLLEPGGMRAPDGGMRGHYWVVSEDGEILVDVTADQFGHPSVIVAAADDPEWSAAYLANYAGWVVDEHLTHVRKSLAEWRAAWKQRAPATTVMRS